MANQQHRTDRRRGIDRRYGAGRRRRTAVRLAAGALAGLTLLAAAPAAFAAAPGPVEPAGGHRDAAALQRALGGLVAGNMTTAAIAEVRDGGRTPWRGAAGVRSLDTGAPAPVDGRFRIGSITKTFVATVVLQLKAERKLGLDDPVERHLPGLLPGGGAITVRQLLNHTSGLFNYTDDAAFAEPETSPHWLAVGRWTSYRPQQLVALAAAHDPYFAPGQGWHYSNTNYIVLGMLIEKVTGHSWNEEVERRVARPLDLRATSMPGTSPLITGPHARGYLKLPAGRADITELNPSMAGAAGAGISSTADLTRFHAALLGGRLLRPAELAEMKTTVPSGGGDGYGLGLMRTSSPCGDLWGHGGGIPGYATLLLGGEDGRRQFALSMTPFDLPDPDAAVRAQDAFVAEAACGSDRRPGA
ncbi:serine hydrolase domain-containing protein [Kitasatospora sp. NPDC049258]|uniref:serine hydrolase domain-containing protein n=1 Tax=Kitasatospora sp. NPDC049258 TaxID=3155394 RepID=UPI0034184A21